MGKFLKEDYPQTQRSDSYEIMHGIRVSDPYRWMEDIDSQPVKEWVEAENRITEAYLSQVPMRDAIRQRIAELWNYEKFGVPFRRGNRTFYMHNNGLQNQNVLFWVEGVDGQPRVLLDPNTLSDNGTVALTNLEVSRDGRMLAYGLSSAGSDWQTWRFRDVDSGQDLPDRLEWVKFSGASWDAANQGIYYSRYDAPPEGKMYQGPNYEQKLYYHRLGEPQANDRLVYARPDQREWGFTGQVTDDGRYLVISVWRGTRRETGIFWQDLQTGDGEVHELLNNFDAAYAFIGNDGPHFYIHTDQNAPLGRVIAIDVNHPDRSEWREVVPQGSDAVQGVSLIGDWLVVVYLHDAYSSVAVFDLNGRFLRLIELPGMGSVAGFQGKRQDRETFYLFTGFTVPGTIYRYRLDTGETSLFRKPVVHFDADDYVTEQVTYTSKDGTRVPMFLSHKKGVQPNGDLPTLLYGYGGFNLALTPAFSVANLVWMEMGGLYAQANLRGGGEYGNAWHQAGMGLQKQNVFDDFIAAGEWLVQNGYTRRERLAIGGRSNGGLLAAACLTQRPDLFGACLVAVGVLDMLRFHKFTIGWAWASDYGSPDNPEEFRALLAYSPYHNVKPGTQYPATLITTADHDDRVYPAHSFKFAAALQAAQAGDAPVLIRVETQAGHGIGKPTTKLIEDAADMWAFLVENLGMEK